MTKDSHQKPSREEVAQVVRELIDATDLTLTELAAEAPYSRQSWSAYQRGERLIPPDAWTLCWESPLPNRRPRI